MDFLLLVVVAVLVAALVFANREKQRAEQNVADILLNERFDELSRSMSDRFDHVFRRLEEEVRILNERIDKLVESKSSS